MSADCDRDSYEGKDIFFLHSFIIVANIYYYHHLLNQTGASLPSAMEMPTERERKCCNYVRANWN